MIKLWTNNHHHEFETTGKVDIDYQIPLNYKLSVVERTLTAPLVKQKVIELMKFLTTTPDQALREQKIKNMIKWLDTLKRTGIFDDAKKILYVLRKEVPSE